VHWLRYFIFCYPLNWIFVKIINFLYELLCFGTRNMLIKTVVRCPILDKEKVQKDKERSTKHTYKTKDRVTRTPLFMYSAIPLNWIFVKIINFLYELLCFGTRNMLIKTVVRCSILDKEKVALQDRLHLTWGQMHMTGEEKCDLLIQMIT
jgi:hypothetical protein